MTTPQEATAAGYRALTTAYFLKKERAMMEAVVADMERGGIEHVLIEESAGRFSVWRKGWIELPDPGRSVVRGIRGVRD